jgi:hypothetical protein
MSRDYDTSAAHRIDFMLIDYGFEYKTQMYLIEVLAEVLEYDDKNDVRTDPHDAIHNVAGEWTCSMSHYDLADLWKEINCYQIENDENTKFMTIETQMIWAIEEIAHELLNAVVADTETPSQALYRINKLFPVKAMATA